MAQWASFTVVAVFCTISLLLLARQSQQLIAGDTGQLDRTDSPTPRTADADRPTAPGEAVAPERRLSEGVTPSDGTGSDNGVPSSTDGLAPNAADATRERAGPPDPTAEIELTPALLLANVAVTQGGVVVLVLGAAWYFSIPGDALGVTGDPWSTGLPALAVGVAFGAALWIGNELSTALADAAGASYDESLRELLSPTSAGGWAVLFALVLPIIALSEEVLFRAALIGVPAAGFDVSPWLLAIVASIAFALGHGAQGRVGIVVTGLLGFVLAAGYVVSGSLLVVVVAHYLINALEFFVHEYLGVGTLFDAGSG